MIGREWAIKNGFNSKGMCQAFIDSVVTCFENFKPRERFTVLNTEDPKTFYPDGIIFGSAGDSVIAEFASPIKAAEAMAILQSAQELFAPLNPTVNFATGDDFLTKRDAMREELKSRFADLARCLEKYDGKYFIDDTPRAAEFAAYHHFDLSRYLDPEILNSFPRLLQFTNDIESINSISSYLENRPKLVDVGIEPKLIIDGKAQPTGVQKT